MEKHRRPLTQEISHKFWRVCFYSDFFQHERLNKVRSTTNLIEILNILNPLIKLWYSVMLYFVKSFLTSLLLFDTEPWVVVYFVINAHRRFRQKGFGTFCIRSIIFPTRFHHFLYLF